MGLRLDCEMQGNFADIWAIPSPSSSPRRDKRHVQRKREVLRTVPFGTVTVAPDVPEDSKSFSYHPVDPIPVVVKPYHDVVVPDAGTRSLLTRSKNFLSYTPSVIKPLPSVSKPLPSNAVVYTDNHRPSSTRDDSMVVETKDPEESISIDPSFLSNSLFADYEHCISVSTLKAIDEVFSFDKMTVVQQATVEELCKGHDVFAKAKTGGGKTLAFLIPLIEQLNKNKAPGNVHSLGALIVTPTRELALQILKEAELLLTFRKTWRVTAVIGGRNLNSDVGRMTNKSHHIDLDILIGTPGRLVDHIQSTPGFSDSLGRVEVLVLDEADRLLDLGFKPQLDAIRNCLNPSRQTMLFSATVAEDVKSIAKQFLGRDYVMIDTVGQQAQSVNVQVDQQLLVVPFTSVVPALARILINVVRNDRQHKVLVFFTTARLTSYLAELFGHVVVDNAKLNIIEMHSRKSQSYRISASEKFKNSSGVIMFSSDVSARGMDYAGIKTVIQVGLTDRETYIHRIGRTARAGRSGTGLLLLADVESSSLLHDLHDIGLRHVDVASACGSADYKTPISNGPLSLVASAVESPVELSRIVCGVQNKPDLLLECSKAYQATLGFYNSHLKRLKWDRTRLVSEINRLFLTLGCHHVPVIGRDVLGKMNLRGVAGIVEGPAANKGRHGHRDDYDY